MVVLKIGESKGTALSIAFLTGRLLHLVKSDKQQENDKVQKARIEHYVNHEVVNVK
jgi:hypothetical protein